MRKVRAKALLLLILLFTSISFGYTDSKSFIIDKANVLSDIEEDNLNKILLDYENNSSVELVGMTIDSLNGEDIIDYCMGVFGDFEIGKPKVNNGGLILIAIKDRKFRISTGYGLEWPVDDNKAGLIVNEMIPYLKESKYYEALEHGFNKLINLTNSYSWNIEDNEIENLGINDIGKIFSFKGKLLRFEKDKSNVTKEVLILTEDQNIVLLNSTKHMNGLLFNLFSGDLCIITARLKNLNPLAFDLLGITN